MRRLYSRISRPRPPPEPRTAREALAAIDRNDDGHISRAEVLRALRAPEHEWLRASLGLPARIRQEDGTRDASTATYRADESGGWIWEATHALEAALLRDFGQAWANRRVLEVGAGVGIGVRVGAT